MSSGSGAFQMLIPSYTRFYGLLLSTSWNLFLAGQHRKRCLIVFAKSIELFFDMISFELLYLNVTTAIDLLLDLFNDYWEGLRIVVGDVNKVLII